jgi:hypothetical protein
MIFCKLFYFKILNLVYKICKRKTTNISVFERDVYMIKRAALVETYDSLCISNIIEYNVIKLLNIY